MLGSSGNLCNSRRYLDIARHRGTGDLLFHAASTCSVARRFVAFLFSFFFTKSDHVRMVRCFSLAHSSLLSGEDPVHGIPHLHDRNICSTVRLACESRACLSSLDLQPAGELVLRFPRVCLFGERLATVLCSD